MLSLRRNLIDPSIVEEVLRRLNPSLPPAHPPSIQPDTPTLNAPPISRPMIDVGEPPVDVNAPLERILRQPDMANYSTGVANHPTRAPMIPEARTIDTTLDPSGVYQPTGEMPTLTRNVDLRPQYGSKLEALRGSSPQSKIAATDGGYRAEPPQRMSRLKAFGLGALRGFGVGGLGGALAGGGIGLVSPSTIQNSERRQETNQAEGDFARNLQLQREGLQNQDIQAQIVQRNNAPELQRLQNKEKDYQATVDNLRQLRTTTDPAEFEKIKRQEEIRLGRPILLPRYSKQDEPRINREFNLPPGGARYIQNPDGTVSTIAERALLPEKPNTDAVGKGQADLESVRTRIAQAQTAAETYQSQLKALDEAAKNIPTYGPQMVKDENGIHQVAINPDGTIAYGTDKTPERVQYERQREEIQKKLEGAQAEWNKANADLKGVYVPESRGALTRNTGGQRWSASRWAQANPNGDLEAAKRAAIAAGHQVVE